MSWRDWENGEIHLERDDTVCAYIIATVRIQVSIGNLLSFEAVDDITDADVEQALRDYNASDGDLIEWTCEEVEVE